MIDKALASNLSGENAENLMKYFDAFTDEKLTASRLLIVCCETFHWLASNFALQKKYRW